MNSTLQVTGSTTLKDKLLLDNATYNSTAVSNGALVVAGGAGIGKNLYVGGNFNVTGAANLGGNTTLGAKVIVADASSSTAPENGALVVAGGVGVGKELNVKGATAPSNTLKVAGKTTLADSLLVAGGTSFAKDLSTEGQLLAKGLKVSTTNAAFVASFENLENSEGDGIEIKLGRTHPALNGSGYLNITNPGVEAFQLPINTIRGWIIEKKATCYLRSAESFSRVFDSRFDLDDFRPGKTMARMPAFPHQHPWQEAKANQVTYDLLTELAAGACCHHYPVFFLLHGR